MFPDWLEILLFGFVAFLIVCGAVLFAIVVVGIVRMLWDDTKKGRSS